MKHFLPICIATAIVAVVAAIARQSVLDFREARRQDSQPIFARTATLGPTIYTVQHDGHRFVAITGGGIMHHPDCPCGK